MLRKRSLLVQHVLLNLSSLFLGSKTASVITPLFHLLSSSLSHNFQAVGVTTLNTGTMAPLISSAKATLAYPLYAVDFDPLDATRLVVGGGGGAGKTGVGNKIVSELGCAPF